MPDDLEDDKAKSQPTVPVKRAEDFVSVLSSRFSAGYTDDRMFFIDFRRPDLEAFSDPESGEIGLRGQHISVAQVTMPPSSLKELHKILGQQIEDFEDRYGEIPEDNEGEEEE